MKYLLLLALTAVTHQAIAQTTSTEHKKGPSDTAIFTYVDEMPAFRGNLRQYLTTNLRYPDEARQRNIHGRVTVRFLVNKKGKVTDIQIVKGIGGGCDEEAIRVVKAMPRWKPGKQNGKRIIVYYNLPLNFELN